MRLGQLWYHQGRRADARDVVADVYNWFSPRPGHERPQKSPGATQRVASRL